MAIRSAWHAQLLALLCCLLLMAALTHAAETEAEASGRVLISVGDTTITAADGSVRSLTRGMAVREGDTLNTGSNGRIQIRFLDGSRMSLRPDSTLTVDAFSYSETTPPAQQQSRLSLARGGFRTLTGRVAQNNRDAYRVTTPFAVIGVRGTDWNATIADVGEGERLFLGVEDGGIFAENDGGTLDLGADADFDFAVVTDFGTPPEGIVTLPPELGGSPDLGVGTSEDDGDETAEGSGGDADEDSGERTIIIGSEDEDDGEGILLTFDDAGESEEAPILEIRQRCL